VKLDERNFSRVIKFISYHWYSKEGVFKDGDNLVHVFKDTINTLDSHDMLEAKTKREKKDDTL